MNKLLSIFSKQEPAKKSPFLDTYIVLIPNEAIDAKDQIKSLGLSNINSDFSEEDFVYNQFRLRIDDIKYYYASLYTGIIIIELYETDGNFMIKDDISRVKKLLDEYHQ